MGTHYDEILGTLDERAPSLASVVASARVRVPPRLYKAALKDAERLLKADVLGVKEVSELTGIARPNVYKTPGMPEPRQRLSMGSVWDGAEIRAYAEKRRDHHKRAQKP